MKRLSILIVCLFISTVCSAQQKLTDKEIQKKVDELISQMTLKEKVGQMTQITLDVLTAGGRYTTKGDAKFDSKMLEKAINEYKVGSVLNAAASHALDVKTWRKLIQELDEQAHKNVRYIPILYGIDAIHGVNYTQEGTLYPQQIGLAATANVDLVKSLAQMTAYETRASAITWTFSPVLDLGADPRFARQWESFGEDTYLAGEMGAAFVKGFEGDNNDINTPYSIAACVKHFLAYSAIRTGKDRTSAPISKLELYEYHLPAFKAALDAGAQSLMVNSGLLNGTPIHADKSILTTLLRDSLNFEGVVVTDWQDINNLYQRDRVASSLKEAAKIAINAGVDMSMVPYDFEEFADNLVALVNEGEVSMDRIDEAVSRILTMKFKSGLFEQVMYPMDMYPEFASQKHLDLAYQGAAESITLLKNDKNTLPLDKDAKLNILVAGPNANSMRALNGGWSYSWQGDIAEGFTQKYNTILEAAKNTFKNADVTYYAGVKYNEKGKYFEMDYQDYDKTIKAAKKADVVFLCVGENSYTEKPGDLNDLYLNEKQMRLAKEISSVNKNVILILNEGRPRIISPFAEEVPVIVQTYLPGNRGADALLDILVGKVNPSGILPYTYPRYPNALITYNHKPSEERFENPGVYDYSADFNPQFQFGEGLSYTSFDISKVQIDKKSYAKEDVIKLTLNVKNTGNIDGAKAVLVYSKDEFASVSPDVKRLRAFDKVFLKAGEQKEVQFEIPVSELSFVNASFDRVVEAGAFQLMVGETAVSFEVK